MKKEKNLTIYDIATKAGVSVSTVSRVINNAANVAPNTREHVEKIMAKYSYSPSDMARGLVHNSMKIIGVLASDIRNMHFSNAAFVLENCFFSWDYSTLLCNTGEDLAKKKKYITILARKKIDALVLVGSIFDDKEIEDMICAYLPNTPVIISNSSLSIPNSYSVLADHDYGMELAIAHLVEKGHRRIAFVHSEMTFNIQRKLDGFLKALQARNLPCDPERNVHVVDLSIEGAEALADKLMAERGTVTAVIFSEDLLALGAVNRWKERGLRIPEDLAVIGNDNSVFAVCSQPKLTTVDTKIETIAHVVANTLHSIFQKKDVGQSIMIRPELVIREST